MHHHSSILYCAAKFIYTLNLLKVIWKTNMWNFWIKYVHLICQLILTKINCMTLKIRSKADFKSKSQNIWQQIILFSSTVMQMICVWHKIWTLSGRLSLMCNVQLMKKNIYIPCVPHKNNCINKIGSHDMKRTNSSIIIVMNVCVLTSASMIVYLFFTRSWSEIIGPKLFFTRSWSAIIGTNQLKVNQPPQQWRGW